MVIQDALEVRCCIVIHISHSFLCLFNSNRKNVAVAYWPGIDVKALALSQMILGELR